MKGALGIKLAIGCGLLVLSGCSKDESSGGADKVTDDRYVFAANENISVDVINGVLANDGADYKSVELLSSASNGTVTLNNDGSFSYVPTTNAGVDDSFKYSAKAADGDTKQGVVSLLFPIKLSSASCTEIDVLGSSQASFNVLASAIKESDGLSFSIVQNPKKGTVSALNAKTGSVSYLFSGQSRGMDALKVSVSDRYGSSSVVSYDLALTPVRIMPLGDSLTEGVESDSDGSGNPDLDSPSMPVRVGYRKALFDLLNGDGYKFDFVGSQTDAGFNQFSDFQHQGHPGYTDAEISGVNDPNGSNSNGEFNVNTDGVFKWLDQNAADVVLLHAGTNNVNNRQSDIYIKRILDEINRWQSTQGQGAAVKTLVAKIVDKGERGNDDLNPNQNVETFNDNVDALVTSRIASGEDLVLVDMYSAVPSSFLDSFDKTHLTPDGYRAMAKQWRSSMINSSALAKCK
jgi:hypothetical protein